MAPIHEFFKEEYPHVDSDLAWGVHELLDSLNDAGKLRDTIRTLLAKKSLSIEQKLTFVAAMVAQPDEEVQTYVDMNDGDFNSKVYDALFECEDVSVLDGIE